MITPFMQAAEADLTAAGGKQLFIPELDMTVLYDVATGAVLRRILNECKPGDDLKASAMLVRDCMRSADGTPLVPRDDSGLRFLLEKMRPSILVRLSKTITGPSAEEVGND